MVIEVARRRLGVAGGHGRLLRLRYFFAVQVRAAPNLTPLSTPERLDY